MEKKASLLFPSRRERAERERERDDADEERYIVAFGGEIVKCEKCVGVI